MVVGLLAAAPAAGQNLAPSFAAVLPEAVVDVSGWETVSGEFETATARGSYLFYVNPRLQAIYQVMRYRVELLSPPAGLPSRRPGERLAYIRKPGAAEPMRCWRRNPDPSVVAWTELTAGTAEYKLEMSVLMQVLAVHRVIRGSQAP
jgi:hypothetical protein